MDYKIILHYIALTVFTYIFGYAALYKILKMPGMMAGMKSMGFGETGTLLIGYAEALGVIGILVGLFFPYLKNLSVLWLLPFAIGAFTTHLAFHHNFMNYMNSLIVCVLPFVILATEKTFKITFG